MKTIVENHNDQKIFYRGGGRVLRVGVGGGAETENRPLWANLNSLKYFKVGYKLRKPKNLNKFKIQLHQKSFLWSVCSFFV